MTRWEILEDWLLLGPISFNSTALADDLGVDGYEASLLIQAYLAAQRGPKSRTSYVLHRTGRTRSAMWHVGHRKADANELHVQHVEDMAHRIYEAVIPDLQQMGFNNPQVRQLGAAITAALTANLQLLVAGLP